ncbi:MAG: MFS transporter [Clostridia bacterium]|nr:MFS transporter [Clostridia bacterium]
MKRKNGNTIKTKEYFTYALGSFGYASITGYVSSYYNYFLTNCLLLSPAVIGTLMLVSRIWDGVNDPIEGVVIDKTKTRFGKLRPYVLVSVLPLAALTVLMFTVPPFGDTGKTVYTYIVYILFGTVCSFAGTVSSGMGCVATYDGKERSRFITVGSVSRSAGEASPYVFILLITFLVTKLLGENDPYMNHHVTACVCGLGGAALFGLTWFNKERLTQEQEKVTLKDSLTVLFNNKPLLLMVVSRFIGFGIYLSTAVQVYIAAYFLGGSDKTLMLGIPTAVGSVVGMLIVPWFANRFGLKKTYVLFSVFGSAMLTVLYFMGYESLMSEKISIPYYFVLFLTGIRYGNTNIVPNLMLADSLDYKEWKTGLRMEGSANAVMGLTNKVTGALSTALMNYGLAFFRFVSPVTDELTGRAVEQVQSATALTGMHMMFTIIPAAFGLLSIIPILFYDFEGAKKEAILAELRARKHAAVKED